MGVTVLLADDHPIVRQGLRRLLEAEADFKVVGEASNGIEAVQLVERLRPDVLVVDLVMPDLSGIEVLRQARQRSPATLSVVLSMQNSEVYVVEALRNGAMGYILKDTAPSEVVEAIRIVANKHRYLSPSLSEHLIDALLQRTEETSTDVYEDLTPREREVLEMVAKGNTNAEIAAQLSISTRTVELHRANMMSKLGLRNQVDVVRYAIKRGLLSLEN
jgi:DNA-binding NarL/FixJ family response regulator